MRSRRSRPFSMQILQVGGKNKDRQADGWAEPEPLWGRRRLTAASAAHVARCSRGPECSAMDACWDCASEFRTPLTRARRHRCSACLSVHPRLSAHSQ